MKDIMNIAVVNFTAIWGNKETNLKRIKEYSEAAGKRGADMVVFPETALCGYDDDEGKPRAEKMHALLAETVPGPATDEIAKITKKYNMYVVFGLSERAKSDPSKIYNSAAVVGPEGVIDSYRKLHVGYREIAWCERGEDPCLFETPWGPVGVSICCDTFIFPEMMRYYRAKGARLVLNVTAVPDTPSQSGAAKLTIPTYAYVNYVFIASANLTGYDKNTFFMGGSGVVGPNNKKSGADVYVGKMFGDPDSGKPEMYLGTVDLSMADVHTGIPTFHYTPSFGSTGWRPELYKRFAEDVIESNKDLGK